MSRLALSLGGLLLLAAGSLEAQQQAAAQAALYRIDAGASDIRLFVYRAGPLARAGHNHVVSVGHLEGLITLRPLRAESTFELEIPAAALRVDDPALRQAAGAEFASEPSARDVEQTRANMLGERVLDAGRHSSIRLSGQALSEATDSVELALTLELAGRARVLVMPVSLRITEDVIEASGAHRLSHEALGLTPFRVMLGALQVANEMDLQFRVVARRVSPSTP